MKNIQQGDVFLMAIKKIPNGATQKRKDDVAFGEITGHHHFLKGCMVLEKDGVEYVDNPHTIDMVHEDHPKISVPAGKYKICIQQEYFPDGSRNVRD